MLIWCKKLKTGNMNHQAFKWQEWLKLWSLFSIEAELDNKDESSESNKLLGRNVDHEDDDDCYGIAMAILI